MSLEMTESRHPQDDDYPIKPSHGSSGTMIGRRVEDGADGGHPRSFFTRRRKVVLAGSVILTLAAVGGLICLLVKKPWSAQGGQSPFGHHGAHDDYSDGKGGQNGNSGTLPRFSPASAVSISNSVRCNAYTPALDQPFLYGQQPIRGVNLGGWLVLEPFITPSVFEPFLSQNVTDEYSLSKLLGLEKATALIQKHYDSWVTEATFKRIRDLGLNHVRIPVGFWALGNLAPDEPYVPDLSLDYLLQGLRWAAKYGLRVMVELHGAPGSQNGWNHSGRAGKIGWLDGTAEGEKNGERTIAYVKQLLQLLQGPGMEHVSPMFGILNEPAIFLLERERTDRWYKEAFAEMRNITGSGKGPWGVIHDGFLGLTQWEGFMPHSDRLALDVHQYLIFDHSLIRFSRKDQVNFPCDVWSRNMQQSTLKFGPTLVGEFSSATNDCATYLNGIGFGYRWDGTFQSEEDRLAGKPLEEAACEPAKNGHIEGYCSCQTQNRVGSYSQEYRKFLSDFTQTQMDAFEQGMGWFYWNFKTETSALWSYFDGVDQGWIPKDANSRPGGCKALGRPIQPFQED
ncbi:glucan 1,3-beta-glucosidase [Entomortierella parvispora]|uniref:glucan 1,3-beta-glucosidase n=1 Tax=Entomortierella parvispora TaxID=205924 RepID=A0A9P3H1R2_9FUNG|nr:glucan 1,3-beta-glucosidase [Entomortierella parvispora]